MIDHNISDISESEEMYLITIARLVEGGLEAPIPISRLAAELSIQPVSANQMVHKLAEEELVAYRPYKGAELTEQGQAIAQQVLRRRRLWEVFLVEHLGVPAGEADSLACRFEHITPKMVINELADFLGDPALNPQGLPIPRVNHETRSPAVQSLVDVPIGQERLVRRLDVDAPTRAFLKEAGVQPGAVVCPLAVSSCGAMLLQSDKGRLHLAGELLDSVMVSLQPDPPKNSLGE